jgi:biotin carboxylase
MCPPTPDTTSEDVRPLLILISPMGRTSRGYLLESVSRGYRIWTFQDHRVTWERPYLAGYTVLDTLDATGMIAAARSIPADGVLCWDETRILPAAVVAHALGLPGNPPEVIRACRDKRLTRRALATDPRLRTACHPVATLAEARRAATRIGYPIVLKPRSLTGSFGVVRVDSAADLTRWFDYSSSTVMAEVPDRFTDSVLVEEYLDGEEISVDAVTHKGESTPLFVARKQIGFLPYYEEVGHLVDARDPLLSDPELRDRLTAVHAAIGFDNGWTHTEWRLTVDGPRLVEINARSGGDMIPYLGRLATGVDAGTVSAAFACGHDPRFEPDRRRAAAIRFRYPERDTVAGPVRVDRARLPAAVDRVDVLATPGQELRLPPASHVFCRFASVIVSADTAAECRAALDEAEPAIILG